MIEKGKDNLEMDTLTIFGLISVILMLVFYSLEPKSHWFVLCFSGSCVLASVYGFLQGAWPFGFFSKMVAETTFIRKKPQIHTSAANGSPRDWLLRAG